MGIYSAKEFEAIVGENGNIKIPFGVQNDFPAGTEIIVHLTKGKTEPSLRSRGIQEQEIESIAQMQMESRDNIILFLKAEGALSRHRGFVRRARGLLRTKEKEKRNENLNSRKLVLHSDIILEHLITPGSSGSMMRRILGNFFCYTTVFNAIEVFSIAATAAENRFIGEALSAIKILGLNAKNAPKYGGLVRNKHLQRMNALIAGLCIESKLPIVTGQPSDFRMVKGVTLVTPNYILNEKKG